MNLIKEKIKAVNKCILVWEKIRETGCWKHEAYDLLKIPDDTGSCPACQFDTDHGGGKGTYCYYEGGNCIVDWPNGQGCQNEGSPYAPYHQATMFAGRNKPEVKKEIAVGMVKLLYRTKERYVKENKK